MMIFLAIAVAAVGIATLVVAISFGKRTEKHVLAMLARVRDSAALENKAAINELRAEVNECVARLDWLTAGLPAEPEPSSASPGYETGAVADVGSPGPDPWGDI